MKSIGHTVTSQRQVVDGIISELQDYRRSLREEDRPAFDKVLSKFKLHIANISFACSYNTWAFVLISIILEQEKEIMQLEKNALSPNRCIQA
ncbi:MAG: hypothetical protein V1859_09345 [archaeon]